MACQKVCKQGRDDIIVKVNLQSPIPTSFYIAVTNQCQNDAGMWLCKFTFTIISSLPCLHTFWHAIPTSFYIFNVFKSCIICSMMYTAYHKLLIRVICNSLWARMGIEPFSSLTMKLRAGYVFSEDF